MIQESILSLVMNVFILELIPFIYIKSFGCSDYLASEDKDTMMVVTKFFIRLLALIISVIMGFFIFGGRVDPFVVHVGIGVVWFIILLIFYSPVEKFIIFKTDSLKKRCTNYEPRFKLSDK